MGRSGALGLKVTILEIYLPGMPEFTNNESRWDFQKGYWTGCGRFRMAVANTGLAMDYRFHNQTLR